MHESEQKSGTASSAPMSKLDLALNLLTAPSEAFTEIAQRPSKLFPLLVIICSYAAVLLWYFTIVDYGWFVDDILSRSGAEETELEDARAGMLAVPTTVMKGITMLSSIVGIMLVFVIQATYFSLVAALRGDDYKFGHWFSLVCWAGLPFLLSAVGMAVTILLSPTGQLSIYDLDPLALRNLGMQSDNASIQSLYDSVSLSALWSIVLMLLAYRQWSAASWFRTASVVLAPYVVIIGIWTYFALA